MGILSNIGGLGDIAKSVDNIIDGVITNDEERLTLKKELYEIITNYGTAIANIQGEVLKIEAQGSKLQRNWRPIVMLSFAFLVIYEYFISPVCGFPSAGLPEKFWSLLEIGLGGYVIGRSAEKIVSSVTDKVDIIPQRLRRNGKK